jgi:hypothetical protein
VVELPPDNRLKVQASTGTGEIRNDFGLPVSGFVSRGAKGNLGDGSEGSLRLESGVGEIQLKKK